MYKIPPTFYLKRALRASTPQDSLKYWACHWNLMATRSLSVVEQYQHGMIAFGRAVVGRLN